MGEKTITLPDRDWLVIDQALQALPYARVNEVFARMIPQFAAQNEQEAGPSPEAKRVLRDHT